MAGKKLILPILGATVVAAGGAAAYFHFNRPAGDLSSPLASAKVVPDEAFMAAFVSTDQTTWSKLSQFGTPEAQKLLTQSLQDLQKSAIKDNKIDFEKDLQPWMGDIMVAALPAQGQAKTPDALIVIGIKDKTAALAFANKMKNEAGVTATETDYKGVKITKAVNQKNSESPTYMAVLSDYLLIGSSQGSLERAIDTSKGEPSLASKPGAEDLLTNGVKVQNPVARFYVLDYAALFQEMAKTEPSASQFPPSLVDQLKQIQGVAFGVGIDDAGVRVKGVGKLIPNSKIQVEYKPAPGKVIAQFPADTMAMLSGAGIKQYWAQVVQQSETVPESKQAVDLMRGATQMVGVDLDRDLFGWMDGEFGLAMIPSKEGILAQTGFGGVMVFDTSDRKAAEVAFNKFDAFAKQNTVSVTQRTVQGKKVTDWIVPGAGGLVSHGWLDDDTVFMAFGSPMADVITQKPAQPLHESASFKTMTGSLASNNLGYFYLDMDKAVALMKGTILASQDESIPAETMAILNSIKGVGMTSSQPDKSTGEFEMLISLKPATK